MHKIYTNISFFGFNSREDDRGELHDDYRILPSFLSALHAPPVCFCRFYRFASCAWESVGVCVCALDVVRVLVGFCLGVVEEIFASSLLCDTPTDQEKRRTSVFLLLLFVFIFSSCSSSPPSLTKYPNPGFVPVVCNAWVRACGECHLGPSVVS